jgi:ribosomal-protein-alanine N-acetyltransferase
MKGIEIQPMQASHLPGVLEIEKDVFPAPWSEGMFRQELSRKAASRMRVAMFKKKVVGYYLIWFLEDMVHLINIAVAGRFHRKGIGTVLLDEILAEATNNGKRYIALEVRVSNKTAQLFYDKFHFDKIGVRKRYYSDNFEDAVLMIRDLDRHPYKKGMGEKGAER